MNFIDTCMVKWEKFRTKMQPTMAKANQIAKKIADKTVYIWNYVMKFKKIFLCVPVVVMALILAIRNLFTLPALVGLDLQGTGEFSVEIIREVAVLGPLAITAVCLLLVFLSKRTLTPWFVSVLSLAVPLLIQLTNTFPA